METIQRFELNRFYDHSLFCPFCGQKVLDHEAGRDGRSEDIVRPCEHTLFVAHDEGFEYRSPRFDADRKIEDVEYEDPEFPNVGLDALTDQVTIQDSLKIAAYVGAPSGFGSYAGFAPVEPS